MIAKGKWIELLKDWSEKTLPEMFPREINIDMNSSIKRSISIIGPRRAGKTYEMYLLMEELAKKIGKDKTAYINFERADLDVMNEKDLMLMLEAYHELYPENKNKTIWLFLDEIQNVSKWERFVRTCLDEGIHIVISGSSSKLLSKEIATSMAGRNISYTLLPFSFKEYLTTKGFKTEKHYSSSEKAKISNLLNKYLIAGGYPEAILYPEMREKILKDIFETAILKDVIERNKIRNITAIKILIKALLTAKEFSANKFYNQLKSQGIKISKTSIYSYLNYFEDAFFIFQLRKFSLSYKKSEQSIPKIYFVDNGLLSIHGIDDKGRLLENLVFIELLRKEKEISYYKSITKEEVDFVIRKGKKVEQLIQACYDTSKQDTFEREVKALIKASNEFNCKNLLIITKDEEKEQIIKGKKIKIIPLWKWLLN
ncbi:MAG: ATP-binding protein [Nanoarchaeota archaeon]|nr:ATP-binding protein [Nanoarchaeota archaeon]MBU1320750.1 ATP-binding protein [Nanoarchaeota archaeon]MBU1597809.1 ATP-binding protein [Nanoarchaeota archaeon]MBU2441497.1 ATP-binding protein [Nanoarchaeota archaeon]